MPGPVPLDDAIKRVLTYCTEPNSGWGVYDLAARAVKDCGVFDAVAPWSLLLANALNGQVTLGNVADFNPARRAEFAQRLSSVPERTELRDMDADTMERVVAVCSFGFPGVWGPKITKLGALYRPHAIPVLDGHVAQAFGFSSEGFSAAALERGLDRVGRVRLAITALALAIRDHSEELIELRNVVKAVVPEIATLADLRLIDIVIWTSQDDRLARSRKKLNRWLDGDRGIPRPASDFEPVPLRARASGPG